MQRFRTWALTTVAVAVLTTACSSATSETSTTASLAERDTSASRELPQTTMIGSDVGDVTLPDVSNDGEPFVMTAPAGGALVVYFGFTACPDVCPTTMADLRTALTDLGETADQVEVAMATIDPDRDSDTVITDYVQFFIPTAHALRTDDADALKQAADAFGVSYSVTTLEDGEVEVGHSPFLYAVDDTGAIRAVWAFGAEPDLIASDLADIITG